MGKVIMGIGIPGAGKTTALRSFAERNGYAYVCPDDIRKELTGNEADQSRNKEVWESAYSRVAQLIREGRTVVVDATFTNKKQRVDFLNFTRRSGAEKVQGIFADVALETAKERNALRDKKVPEAYLDHVHERITNEPPEAEEGFDAVFTIDEYQNLKEAEVFSDGEVTRKTFGKPR